MHRSSSLAFARRRTEAFQIAALAALVFTGCREPRPGAEDGQQEPEAVEHQRQALVGVWSGTDVGAVGVAGTHNINTGTGTYTLEGGGTDIWNAADSFRFVYQTVAGNTSISAQVVSLENTNGFAKAGVMMRETLAAGSKNVMALVTPTTANGYRFQRRIATNGTTDKVIAGTATGTGWVRLTRSGNSFSAFYSTNSTNGSNGTWTAIGPAVTITMASSIEVGLAVTSHYVPPAPAVLATAEFNNVVFNPPITPPAPPSAPSNLTATAGNAQVALSWTASAGATSYTVKRATTTGGPYSNVATGLGTTSYTNTSLINGQPYFYVVTAVNSTGESGNSNEASATPAPPPPPNAPSNLTATAGNAQVALSWSAVSGATSYNVKRADDAGGPYTTVATAIATASYTNTGLINGQPYFYVVSAVGGGGESDDSNEASATPTLPPAPLAPTGLSATPGNTQIALSWSPASGATSYAVKSSTTVGGPYTVVPGAGALTGTSYTHTGLPNGSIRYYVVTASNAGGESPASTEVFATPTAPPPVTWTSKIIGTVASGATGSYSENPSGTHNLSAGGSDIYGTADNFRFTYQTINGDATITARVGSLIQQNAWTKAVVMIRDNDTAGARNVAVVVSPTATNKYRRQVRTTAGGSSATLASTADSAIPSWIRLQRTGNSFQAFHSSNGTSWTAIGTALTQTLNSTALVGIGVTSHTTTANVTTTGVFTNVSIVTPAPPQAPAGPDRHPGEQPGAPHLVREQRGLDLHGQAGHHQRRPLQPTCKRASPPPASPTPASPTARPTTSWWPP